MAAGALLAACATAPTSTAPSRGYLDAGQVSDLSGALPPSSAFQAEALPSDPGDDRLWLAIAHAELRPPWAAQHFDCALGARLDGAPRPALNRLMARVLIDADSLTRRMAERAHRPRPIAAIEEGKPCQRIDAATQASPSWPAAGAVVGAAYGEMFAALAPDVADAARHVGREIGLSRAICHMNWSSDVQDGAMAGLALYDAIERQPDFQTDLQAARDDVSAARASGLTSPACAAERRALSPRPDAG